MPCLPFRLVPETMAGVTRVHTYNEALPLMLARYCGPGLLGLGVTALIAGFMSGMAGNVSAFATVWTYDIYKPLIQKAGQRAALSEDGKMVFAAGRDRSIGTAYLVMNFSSIIVYAQMLFGFLIVPMFGTVILGALWKRTTPAAGFLGIAGGDSDRCDPVALGERWIHPHLGSWHFLSTRRIWPKSLSVHVDFDRQRGSDSDCTMFTKPKSDEQLRGLVYGLTSDFLLSWKSRFSNAAYLGGGGEMGFVLLNLIFW